MAKIRFPVTMTVYMLRDSDTGLYYRRKNRWGDTWVEQKKASIWTSRNGPAQVKSVQLHRRHPKLQIVPFELVEKP